MSDGYAPGRENIPARFRVQARPGTYGALL
jgi:hypothetical protein